ncbi:methyltransferase, FkbM family [Owenweeksia hongkongensis DSM 17368]|uniref:Methyltransferase, FkbM family n=1 Tax=Owenweeksia hongkongensis (strain DSM 17368 / CIP 108786 / JCM 12287 / NRRL B-23963 / UST20020801) TaxID=926562 RepID=G8R509_OWEHD|nr:FkbM family methyltransferase [Owenweeksia hongkongensis]AEV34323.1 methyltransferase, FkbM family [Owenweeksia hongkongensis DSM 17368]
MNALLIFDIGMHKGEDTAFYLSKGYQVVAVDADPNLINAAKEKFQPAHEEGRLRLENLAISENAGEVDFYLSAKSIWNSLNSKIADRLDSSKEVIKVKTNTLKSLFEKYGVPDYCKIDIEGYDIVALRSLDKDNLPKYISVESECLGESDELLENEVLATLNQMHALGYKKFKLVDQQTLKPLTLGKEFYNGKKEIHIVERLRHKFKFTYRHRLGAKHDYNFPYGATGPFGEDIDGKWYNFDDAQKLMLTHRKQFFETNVNGYSFSFWCDWHAKID